jgi:hypothetical protein
MQRARLDGLLATLAAAISAVERGDLAEAIGHLSLGTQQCVQLATPPPPPAWAIPSGVLEPDEALDIHAVSTLTGYSVTRLRHRGHTLPGFKKWPDGKVTWWKRQLVAGIQSDTHGRRR